MYYYYYLYAIVARTNFAMVGVSKIAEIF